MTKFPPVSEKIVSAAASQMKSHEFEQVVEAILEGKYSWACLLVLRFAGYNPAHYIPYRTYKRLIKHNQAAQASKNPSGFRESAVLPYRQTSRTMDVEQFNQVVQAVLEGKYSWGCLLVLRFAGYNPVHYIPYRTYKRLVKENRPRSAKGSASSQRATTAIGTFSSAGIG